MEDDYGTIEAYEPSPLEDQRQRIAEFLKRNGISNNASAQRQGKNLSMISELIPGYGDYVGVQEGFDMMQKGDRLGGGIMTAASMLPLVPASAVTKYLTKRIAEVAARLKQARFNAARERRNIPTDGDPARRKAAQYDAEVGKLSKEHTELGARIKADLPTDVRAGAAFDEMMDSPQLDVPQLYRTGGEKTGLRTLSPAAADEARSAKLALYIRKNEALRKQALEGELLPPTSSFKSLNESDNLPGYGPEELAAIQKEVKDRMAGENPYLDDFLRNLLDE